MRPHIPNIVHFIYGLKSRGEPFHYFHYLAVLSAIQIGKPDIIYLHCEHEPSGSWWKRTLPLVTLIHHQPRTHIGHKRLIHYAHRADVLRLEILLQMGGVYFDIDTLCLRSWHHLLNHSFVIGEELQYNNPVTGLSNAVMFSIPGSAFVRRWLEAYPLHFSPGEWAETACLLPRLLAAEPRMKSEIRIEPPERFHSPTGPWLFAPGEVPSTLLVAHYWGHTAVSEGMVRRSCPQLLREAPELLFSKMVSGVFGQHLPGED
jgi:hypothetical protein